MYCRRRLVCEVYKISSVPSQNQDFSDWQYVVFTFEVKRVLAIDDANGRHGFKREAAMAFVQPGKQTLGQM